MIYTISFYCDFSIFCVLLACRHHFYYSFIYLMITFCGTFVRYHCATLGSDEKWLSAMFYDCHYITLVKYSLFPSPFPSAHAFDYYGKLGIRLWFSSPIKLDQCFQNNQKLESEFFNFIILTSVPYILKVTFLSRYKFHLQKKGQDSRSSELLTHIPFMLIWFYLVFNILLLHNFLCHVRYCVILFLSGSFLLILLMCPVNNTI